MLHNALQKIVRGVFALSLVLFSGPVLADYALNLTKGVTPISNEVYDLHMIILWVVTVIGILVFAVMIWSIFHHRKSRGAVAAQFHHNTTAEIVWTIIPILILVAMAVPATKTLVKMEATEDADMTIKVTGYQWKWHYEYMDEGFGFFSALDGWSNDIRQLKSGMDATEHDNYLLDVDNPIVLPVNTKVRILTTAADVIHAWWVPALGWKRDAIPGFINDNWTIIEEPGTYRGQCAELCGRDHGFMPIVLKAVPREEYDAWAEEMKLAAAQAADEANKTFAMEELMSKGEAAYQTSCAACHQANGEGLPGAFPALKGGVIATGDLAGHIDIVLNGKAGTAMAAFGGQLNDADLAAIITYERNAWGNDTGDLVQPADIKAAR
ncbi:MAG: cytochrome c oxidase subunit II [Thiotrichales bacterium]|nr:cytochrome c oxidase subunit II [Thiotrichales bacterium]